MKKEYNAKESIGSIEYDRDRDRNISLYVRAAFESLRNDGYIYGGISMTQAEMYELEAAIEKGFVITKEERETATKVLLLTAVSFNRPYLPTKSGLAYGIFSNENSTQEIEKDVAYN